MLEGSIACTLSDYINSPVPYEGRKHVITTNTIKKLVLLPRKSTFFQLFFALIHLEMTLNINQNRNQVTTRSISIVQNHKKKNVCDCPKNMLKTYYFYSEKSSFFNVSAYF